MDDRSQEKKANTPLMSLGRWVMQIESGFFYCENFFMIITFLSMLLLMVAQVIARYVLLISLPWCEELIRFLFIVSSFFGLAVASKEGRHIEVDIKSTILRNLIKDNIWRQKIDRVLQLTASAVSMCVLGVFSYLVYGFLDMIILTDQRSPAMGMSLKWVVGAMFLGAFLSMFHYAIKTFVDTESIAKFKLKK